MLRPIADENFNDDIVRGLLLRNSIIDILRVRDIGLLGVEDPDLLAQCAERNRILLTHDQRTMPRYAYERLVQRLPMAGVFVIAGRIPVHVAVEELLLINECSEQTDWAEQVTFLPL